MNRKRKLLRIEQGGWWSDFFGGGDDDDKTSKDPEDNTGETGASGGPV